MEPTTKECQCGKLFTAEDNSELSWMLPNHCPECIERHEAEREAEQERRVQQKRADLLASFTRKFDAMTPERLRTPNIDHPAFNRDLWRKVAAWNPTREKPWLGLIGETGACKTRCAFLRLRQLLIADAEERIGYKDAPKFSAAFITGMDLSRYVVEQYSKTPAESRWNDRTATVGEIASAALAEARKTDLLILDEIGKVRSSPGTIDELFALIDYRSSRNLVTLWTSNRPPEEFCTAWPEEYASPGAGRIVEASTIIRA